SVTSLVTITVTSESTGKDGDRVTVRLSAERVMPPPSSTPLANSAKLSLFTVAAFSDFEKVKTTTAPGPTPVAPSLGVTSSTTAAFTDTPVALFTGLTADTDGRVVSAVPLAPVVKLLVKAEAALPARSVTTPSLTVCKVLVDSGLAGVKVSARRSALKVTLPASPGPPAVNTTAPAPTDTALSGSSKAKTTGAFTATPLIRSLNRSSATPFRPTPVAPFTGSPCTTVGLVESPVSRVWKVVLPGLSSGCPTRSVISVVSSTVCVVFGRSDAAEVNVTRR